MGGRSLERELRDAVRRGSASEVQALLAAGVDPNLLVDNSSRNGVTLLHVAADLLLDGWEKAAGADPAIVRALLAAGANTEVREATGRTPLCYAAYAGRVAVVRELLAAGADVNARTTSGKNSLMEVARRGHGSVLEMLLAAGADPAMGREKPLAAAAFRGQAAVVSALLAAGVAADARDAAGRTALMYAAMQGHAAVVSAVLEGGADVNARDPQGDTPLLFTAYSQCGARDTQVPPERCISTVQALLAAGADPGARDARHGRTALEWIASGAQGAPSGPATAAPLVGRANPNARGGSQTVAQHRTASQAEEGLEALLAAGAGRDLGLTPLGLAAMTDDHRAIQLLAAAGADVNAAGDMLGMKPLQLASIAGNINAVKALLAAGADMAAADDPGMTALHSAAEDGNVAVVQALVGTKCDLEAQDDLGRTALHLAAENGKIGVVKVLVGAGSDLEAGDFGGHTALHAAAGEGKAGVVQVLVEVGSDVEARDGLTGATALIHAAKDGDTATMLALLAAGADANARDELGATALHYFTEAMTRCLRQAAGSKPGRAAEPDEDADDDTAPLPNVLGDAVQVVRALLASASMWRTIEHLPTPLDVLLGHSEESNNKVPLAAYATPQADCLHDIIRMLAEAGCPIDALLPSPATKAPGGPGAVQPSTLDLWLERMMKEELPEGSSGRALALTRTLLECAVAQGSAQRAPLLAAVSQVGRMGSSELALLGQASQKLTSRGRALQPPLAAYDVHPWQRMLRPQPRPTGLGFSLQQHRQPNSGAGLMRSLRLVPSASLRQAPMHLNPPRYAHSVRPASVASLVRGWQDA